MIDRCDRWTDPWAGIDCKAGTISDVWRKMCRIRAFELNAAWAHRAGRIKTPIYLSIGQEAIPAAITTAVEANRYHPSAPVDAPRPRYFPSHRCHGWYLAVGGDPAALRDELLGRTTGCTGGRGGSASVHIPGVMFGHDGLLGSNAAVAVGYALASGTPTVCVCGDAAAEEDYFLAALGFAVTKAAPVLFVVEDNGLSILTKTEVRRSWSIAAVAQGMGLWAHDIADDDLIGLDLHRLPQLINVKTTRLYWHAGSGQDEPPAGTPAGASWRDALADMRADMAKSGVPELRIEAAANAEMAEIWAEV